MIQILSFCNSLKSIFASEQCIDRFRIVVRSNENVYCYVILKQAINGSKTSDAELKLNNRVTAIKEEFGIISFVELLIIGDECLEDSFYSEIFENENVVSLEHGKRRFGSFLNCDMEKKKDCKVVTFYSYKGGMGRSTTLAAFSLYLSLIKGLNVVVIDCDVEAPGFTNFFLKNPGEENQQNGLIEYCIDKGTIDSSKLNIKSYCRTISKTLTGTGSITIMPAGNLGRSLNTEDNQTDDDFENFIHALSRVDICSPHYSRKLFESILSDFTIAIKPDIILIDSRTGINDIFGISISALSEYAIGFFRDDVQSRPGLFYFLRECKRHGVTPFLFNSILPDVPSEKRNFLKVFSEKANYIWKSITEDEDVNVRCYPVSQNSTLRRLGTEDEVLEDFIALIKEEEFPDFNRAFPAIFESIFSQKEISEGHSIEKKHDDSSYSQSREKYAPLGISDINLMSRENKEKRIKSTREHILNLIKDNVSQVKLYADNNNVYDDFREHRFFLRPCMKDLFNTDKYVILGSKGTGKTYIYEALRIPQVVDSIKSYANVSGSFAFIEAVDKSNKIFSVSKLNNLDDEQMYRFWIIYTWLIITAQIDSIVPDFCHDPKFTTTQWGDDSSTLKWLSIKILDTSFIEGIEKELRRLDNYIQKDSSKTITILYDQLDEIVEPHLWNKWIPPLIRIWRNKRYKSIFGKLFLRRDLFNSLRGVTNIKEVENNAIDIEWNKEEIYSYLIHTIFDKHNHAFLSEMMYLYYPELKKLIPQMRKLLAKDNTPILDTYLIRPQFETLFGKSVMTAHKDFGIDSFDWFYDNLKNADDTISLRPFIKLIQYAIDSWAKGKYRDNESPYPVMYAEYYTEKGARIVAVDQYFEDLSRNQIGNSPMEHIFEYLNSSDARKYKYITLSINLFREMLKTVVEKFSKSKDMDGVGVEQLEQLLITNGIVSKQSSHNGYKFRFSFLYKYKLGLRGI